MGCNFQSCNEESSNNFARAYYEIFYKGGGLVSESFAEGALSRPIETKCLMYVNALDLWSLQISMLVSIGRIFPWGGGLAKESIIKGRAINLRRSSLQLWYRMRDMFKPSMTELGLCIYQLDTLIEQHLPDLHIHFQSQAIHTNLFASRWFLTLFTSCVSVSLSSRYMGYIWFVFISYEIDNKSFYVIIKTSLTSIMLSPV